MDDQEKHQKPKKQLIYGQGTGGGSALNLTPLCIKRTSSLGGPERKGSAPSAFSMFSLQRNDLSMGSGNGMDEYNSGHGSSTSSLASPEAERLHRELKIDAQHHSFGGGSFVPSPRERDCSSPVSPPSIDNKGRNKLLARRRLGVSNSLSISVADDGGKSSSWPGPLRETKHDLFFKTRERAKHRHPRPSDEIWQHALDLYEDQRSQGSSLAASLDNLGFDTLQIDDKKSNPDDNTNSNSNHNNYDNNDDDQDASPMLD